MRAVVQRVSEASVAVDQRVMGAISEPGLLVLVGVTHTDTPDNAAKLAAKVWGLRILEGEKSCSDVAAPLLVISQFTLYADTRKGRRPTWQAAAPLAALDLPLKVLIWDDQGQAKVTYYAPAALAARHHLDADLAAKLAIVDPLTDALVAP